jgi:hypothetical protein
LVVCHIYRRILLEEAYHLFMRWLLASQDVHAIARRGGRVLGLGLYGMDVIEGEDDPAVIDLNYFPSYRGVPDAASMLADYINSYAAGEYHELSRADPFQEEAQDAVQQRPLPSLIWRGAGAILVVPRAPAGS